MESNQQSNQPKFEKENSKLDHSTDPFQIKKFFNSKNEAQSIDQTVNCTDNTLNDSDFSMATIKLPKKNDNSIVNDSNQPNVFNDETRYSDAISIDNTIDFSYHSTKEQFTNDLQITIDTSDFVVTQEKTIGASDDKLLNSQLNDESSNGETTIVFNETEILDSNAEIDPFNSNIQFDSLSKDDPFNDKIDKSKLDKVACTSKIELSDDESIEDSGNEIESSVSKNFADNNSNQADEVSSSEMQLEELPSHVIYTDEFDQQYIFKMKSPLLQQIPENENENSDEIVSNSEESLEEDLKNKDSDQLNHKKDECMNESKDPSNKILKSDEISKWQVEMDEKIKLKDKEESVKIEELRKQANEELENWDLVYGKELKFRFQENRILDGQLIKDSKEKGSSKNWKTVVELIGTKKGKKDTSRLKSILYDHKNLPQMTNGH